MRRQNEPIQIREMIVFINLNLNLSSGFVSLFQDFVNRAQLNHSTYDKDFSCSTKDKI